MSETDSTLVRSFSNKLFSSGIVVDVTFKTVPIYKVRAHNYLASDEILTNGVAVEWAKKADQLMFYWFPPFNEVVVLNYTFISPSEPGKAYNHLVPVSTYATNVFVTQYKELAYNLSDSDCPQASELGNELSEKVSADRFFLM